MPLSLRETAIQLVLNQLNGAGKPSNVPAAKRTYTYVIDANQMPAINVFPHEEVVEPLKNLGSGMVTRKLQVVVEIAAQGSSTDRPDAVIDPIAQWIVNALGGYRPGLGSGFEIVNEGKWEFRLAGLDHSYCLARLFVIVVYHTKAADLALVA